MESGWRVPKQSQAPGTLRSPEGIKSLFRMKLRGGGEKKSKKVGLHPPHSAKVGQNLGARRPDLRIGGVFGGLVGGFDAPNGVFLGLKECFSTWHGQLGCLQNAKSSKCKNCHGTQKRGQLRSCWGEGGTQNW